MTDRRQHVQGNILSRLATAATTWTGSTGAFMTAVLVVVVSLVMWLLRK